MPVSRYDDGPVEEIEKLEKQVQWQPAETAPKDSVFIGDVGLPFAVACMWNELGKTWVYADVQAGMVNGTFSDFYFENTYDEKLLAWLSMPEVKRCQR